MNHEIDPSPARGDARRDLVDDTALEPAAPPLATAVRPGDQTDRHDDPYDDDPYGPDPFAAEEDEEDAPAPRRRRRKVPPLASGLAVVVVAGVGFIAGVQVEKRADGGAGGGMPGGMAAMAGGPSGTASAGDRAGAATGGGTSGQGGATVGEVANVKGSRIYVTASDGSTVEVVVGRKATVQRTASADAGEIRPGDTVVVAGTTRDDGSVAASTVQATASGVTALGGMRGMAGGGSSAPTGDGGDRPDADATSGGGSSSDGGSDDVDQLFESGG